VAGAGYQGHPAKFINSAVTRIGMITAAIASPAMNPEAVAIEVRAGDSGLAFSQVRSAATAKSRLDDAKCVDLDARLIELWRPAGRS
jgi:hypothetical protein